MSEGSSISLVTIPKLVGNYKEVRVTFLGASFFKSNSGPSTRLADDSFAVTILDEIFNRQSILSKRRGLLKKNHHCRKCEGSLMGLKARRRRFTLSITYKQLPTFKVDIQMPAIPCPKCGTSNAVNEENTQQIITGAIAVAFDRLKTRMKQAAD
jgi:hypothetical protein